MLKTIKRYLLGLFLFGADDLIEALEYVEQRLRDFALKAQAEVETIRSEASRIEAKANTALRIANTVSSLRD